MFKRKRIKRVDPLKEHFYQNEKIIDLELGIQLMDADLQKVKSILKDLINELLI
ncbi:hypothetical protein [Candidatus Coxiella mudrowiae]|uniref:hypothetical protein n=1 Tax=Candidatus Coxiella mudrowiae TaxID=2054173 RepID=UPI0012FE8554|nr:hypothetical protein [Candidatus Coxiella mudrowiae]